MVSCANTSETISGYEPSKIVDARDRDEVRLEEERDAARAKIEMEGFIVDSEDEEEEDGSFSGSGSEDEEDGSGSEDDDDESSAGSSVMSCEPPPKQPKKRRVIADDDDSDVEVVERRGQGEAQDIEALRRWATGGGGEDDPIEVMSSTRSVHGEEAEEEVAEEDAEEAEEVGAEADGDASRDMLMTISLAPSPIPTPSEFSSVAADVSAMSHREGPSPIVVMSTEMLTPPPNHAWIGPNLVVIPPPPAKPEVEEAAIPEEEEEPMLTLEDVVRAARASV